MEIGGTPDIPLFIYKPIISNDLSPLSTGEPRPRRIFIPKYMRFFASKTHYSWEAPCHARTVSPRRATGFITQRGNDRQRVFLSDADRQYFLDLLAARSQECAVRVAAYTLMSTPFHLVAIGDQADTVSLFMMDLSGLYATYRNAVHRHTGHLWQSRFYSAVLDSAHWATALRLRRTQPRPRAHRRAG